MKVDIEQIIKKSKELKSYPKFKKESDKLRALLDKLSKSKDLEYNKILSEWFIIKLVIMWEYHFKSLIIALIDDLGYQYTEEIKISLNDLKKIQKTKVITAGKIFVSTKNLQNIETVDKILSTLLSINFVKKLKSTFPKDVDVKTVNECLEKRHQIIHEMKQFSFSKPQIRNYASSMMLFMICSSLFCQRLQSKKIDQN